MASLTKVRRFLASGVVASVAAPGLTPSAGATTPPASVVKARAAAGAVTISVHDGPYGPVLVTSAGYSLYAFSGDAFPFAANSPFQLACTALNKAPNGLPCTTAWPPLVASGPLVAGRGVHRAWLSTITRNGVDQVTYRGLPLYRFFLDTLPARKLGRTSPLSTASGTSSPSTAG
ncbi:MAG: COG4315 family predicted lipoprotein [Acidimicrobiales bacterium]